MRLPLEKTHHTHIKAGRVTQLIEHLPSKYEVLSSKFKLQYHQKEKKKKEKNQKWMQVSS
jgi:hypothetical protein